MNQRRGNPGTSGITGKAKSKPQRTSNPRLALEPRIVFDGAGGASAADAYSIDGLERNQQLNLFVPPAVREAVAVVKQTVESPPKPQRTSADAKDRNDAAVDKERAAENAEKSDTADTEVGKPTARVTSQSTEIIFVDASVQDVRAFLNGKSGEVIILDADRDGVEQIAEVLKGRKNVTAVHIISHGDVGQLRLGNATLNQASMAGEHADELATIKAALSVNADILIYGCNFGEGELGSLATDALAARTGADVASSTDVTGNAAKGGNWVLERQTGSIEADLALDKLGQDQYTGAFVLITAPTAPVITAGPNSTNVGGVLTPNTSPPGNVVGGKAVFAGVATGTFGSYTGAIDLIATITAVSAFDVDDTVTFASVNSSPAITVGGNTTGGTVSVNWQFVRTGTTTPVSIDFSFSVGDIDGISTTTRRESITASTGFGLTSYTYENSAADPSHLIVTNDGTRVKAIGTLDEDNANVLPLPLSNSTIRYSWVGVPSVDFVYEIAPNPVTQNARFIMVGNDAIAFTTPAVTALGIDLDGNNSSTALGNDFKNTFYIGGGGVPVVDGDVSFSLPPPNFVGGTIRMATAQTGDQFIVGTLPAGITAVIDNTIAGGISVTLSGTASPADYALALKAISYNNTLGAPVTTDRSISVQLTDGSATTNAPVATIVVSPNRPPVNTLPVSYSGTEDTNLSLTGLSISDANAAAADIMTVTLSVPPGSGTITGAAPTGGTVSGSGTSALVLTGTIANINAYLASAGRPVYVPVADFNGAVVLTMVTKDSVGLPNTGTDTDTRTITLAAVQDIVADTITTQEEFPITTNVITGAPTGAADSFENGARQLASVTQGANGSVTFLSNGTVTYTPNANYVGSDSFTYTVFSGGVTETATVNVTVTALPPILDLNSMPVGVPGIPTLTASELVVGGDFSTGGGTPTAPWFEGTPANAGSVVAGRWDFVQGPGTTANLTQAITVPASTSVTTQTATTTTVTTTSDAVSSIAFDFAWQNEDITGLADSNVLTVSYNGVVYATFTTPTGVTGVTAAGTWSYVPGVTGTVPATVNAVADETTSAMTRIVLNLPTPVSASGNLVFGYRDASAVNLGALDDFAIDNVSVTSTKTTIATVTTADSTDRNWAATFTEGGAAVSIADTDSSAFDASDANMVSATIVLTNAKAGDQLVVSSVPAGFNAVVTPGAGTITVSLTGSFTKAQYADAIEQIKFRNPNANLDTTTRIINSVVNDGTTNSNTAITTIAIDPDTDKDGIGNSVDLDDDNDGILDTVESLGFNGTTALFAPTGLGVLAPANSTAPVTLTGLAPLGGNSITFNAQLTSVDATPPKWNSVQVQENQTGANGTINQLLFLQPVNTAYQDGDAATYTLTFAQPVTNFSFVLAGFDSNDLAKFEAFNGAAPVTLTSANYTTYNADPTLVEISPNVWTNPGAGVLDPTKNGLTVSIGGPITQIRITTGKNSSGATTGNVTLQLHSINYITPRDTDSDGVADSLDLDSDNDGISDLRESGQVSATVDTNNNGVHDGAVNANGIPLASNGGSGFTPINTDGDARPDYLDLDSDNDGIADTVEARATAGYVANDGDVRNNDADKDGVIDIFDTNDSTTGLFGGTFTVPVNTDTLIANNADAVPDYLDTDSDGDGLLDSAESGLSTVVTDANGDGIRDSVGASYADPDGIVNDPQTALSNEIGTTAEVAYRETNRPPVNTVPGTQTATEDVSLAITGLSVNDVDGNLATTQLSVASGNLTIGNLSGATISAGANGTGTLTLSGTQAQINAALATLSYQGNLNFNGADTLTVKSTDSAGTPLSDTDTVAINVTNVQEPPVATPSTSSGAEDTPIPVDLTGTDVDGTVTNVTITTLPPVAQGVLYLADGTTPVVAGTPITAAQAATLVFKPASNFNGTVTIPFTVTDNEGNISASANEVITVSPVNDPPVDGDEINSVTEDTTLTVADGALGDLLNNASDLDGNPLSIAAFTVAGQSGPFTVGSGYVIAGVGTITISANGSYSFAPVANYTGAIPVITYTVNDGAGGTDISTLTLSIVAVNDPPTPVADVASTPVNAPLLNINVLGNDSDPDGDTLTVMGATLNPALGSVVVNPDGTISFTPALNVSGPVIITYTVSDGHGGSVTATLTINVGTNNPPDSLDKTVTTAEDTPIALTLTDFNFTDMDAGQTLINVRIDGIPLTGTLLLNGIPVVNGQVVSVADIATGNLTFTPAPNAAGVNYASMTFSVQDSAGAFDTLPNKLTFDVTPVNDPPVAGGDSASTTLNTPLTIAPITLIGNDTDPEGNPLTVVSVQSATNGTVSLVGGNVLFTPTPGYTGPASFTYTISDGQGGTSTATVSISVNAPGNTPPVAVGDSTTTTINTAVSITPTTLLANDSDIDGNPLTIVSVQAATQGTVALVAGNVVFTPTPGYTGPASFTYTVSDGFGGSATATVNVSVTAAPNNPPVATSDSLTASEGTPVSLSPATLLGNDTDPDGDPLTITSVQGATNGTVAVIGGNVVFTPAPGYSGPASFTYTISDGKGGTSTATVNLTVLPVNDPPVAVDDSAASTSEDNLVTISVASLLGNDTDPDGDPLTITGVQSGVGGTVSLVGGVITFTPSLNFNGPASFTYTVSDGQGGFSTATVTVNVTPVNDPPVAANDSVLTNEDQPLTLTPATLLGNDVDVDGDPLTITGVQGAVNGTVSLVNGVVVFTPAPNYNGPASFTYTMTDGKGGTSTATVNILVVSVNDPPVTRDDIAGQTLQDTSLAISQSTLLGNDSDVDGDPLVITSVQGAENGTVKLVDGDVVFTPNPGYDGPASFTYTVSDRQGGTSTSRVDIKILGVNNPPVSDTNFSVTEERRPNVPGFTTVADPALHVLFSVSDANSEIDLRGDRGLFQTDSATAAELTGALRTDLSFAEGNQFGSRGLGGTRNNDAPRTTNALYVQQAVRHQSLGLEQGLFVHDAVRSSQLESLARSIRIESFSSAVPGVATLLDGFALGSAAALIETQQVGEGKLTERVQVADTPSGKAETAQEHANRGNVAAEALPASVPLDSNASVRRGADSFATQLRRNAVGFKPRMNTATNRPEAFARARA